ncbi:hypothetical protein [Sinorhizobium sojae]|uniref:hypothetical protein n=1 Tax=Sinorhizobium sojae TaxID=716925 RepID=UPI0012FCBFF0|nr:hypothetical protein [Sinorhizobium sojae]
MERGYAVVLTLFGSGHQAGESLPEAVAVLALAAEEVSGGRQHAEHARGTLVIVHLAFG